MQTVSAILSGVLVGADALRINPLRTVLSTLGVVIGVGALVAVLCLGDGMERAARAEIERTTDFQTVGVSAKTSERIDGQTFPVRDYPVFTRLDAAAARAIPGVTDLSLMVQDRTTIDLPETGKRRQVSLSGVLARADDFHHLKFLSGRFFSDGEAQHAARVVIVSYKLAEALMAGRDPASLIGRQVRVNGQPSEVLGVLETYEGERETHLEVWAPFDAAALLLPATARPRATVLLMRAESVEKVAALEVATQDWVAERFTARRRYVEVGTSRSRIAQATQGILMFKLFMGAITGISLVVGGIGIMNVLLASVTERTREIGVRKAMGARRRDILVQFLAESVAVAGTGSIIGIVLGVASAFGLAAIIRSQSEAGFLQVSFSVSTLVVAAIAPVFIGLVFGTYPARRAARLSPIDAIRHE